MIFTVKGEELKLEGLIGFLQDMGFDERLNWFCGEEKVISISSDKYFHKGFSYCAFPNLELCLDVEEDAEIIHENIECILREEKIKQSQKDLDDAINDFLPHLYEDANEYKTSLYFDMNSYLKDKFKYKTNISDQELKEILENNRNIKTSTIGGEEYLSEEDWEKLVEDLNKQPLQFLNTEKGQKFNEGKLPMDIVLFKQFPKAIQAVAKCSLNGHTKYEADYDWLNFKRVEGGSQTYADAALRHNFDKGSLNDSGLPHIFHKLWNVMAEVELYIEENNITI